MKPEKVIRKKGSSKHKGHVSDLMEKQIFLQQSVVILLWSTDFVKHHEMLSKIREGKNPKSHIGDTGFRLPLETYPSGSLFRPNPG